MKTKTLGWTCKDFLGLRSWLCNVKHNFFFSPKRLLTSRLRVDLTSGLLEVCREDMNHLENRFPRSISKAEECLGLYFIASPWLLC